MQHYFFHSILSAVLEWHPAPSQLPPNWPIIFLDTRGKLTAHWQMTVTLQWIQLSKHGLGKASRKCLWYLFRKHWGTVISIIENYNHMNALFERWQHLHGGIYDQLLLNFGKLGNFSSHCVPQSPCIISQLSSDHLDESCIVLYALSLYCACWCFIPGHQLAQCWPTPDYVLIYFKFLTHWGRDKMATILQTTLSNAFPWISIKILLKFVSKGSIINIPALVQIMAWHCPGAKPLSGPMMVRLLTHICVTLPQWVNT